MAQAPPSPMLPASIAVVGLGQLGASLCAALRRATPAVRLIGIARREEIAARAVADSLCDVAGCSPSMLADAELVVLCTPVDSMPEWLTLCASHAHDALVTDVGSTKAWICARGRELLAPGAFCGGHPMAGRERSGYEAANPALFTGRTWVLTPDDAARASGAAATVAALAGAVGATVVEMAAEEHDAACALISHMPFVVSASLMRAANAAAAWPMASRLAATGFSDMVRIAGGEPLMYAGIAATNREPLLAALDALGAELAAFRAGIADGDSLVGRFGEARQARDLWLSTRAVALRAPE